MNIQLGRYTITVPDGLEDNLDNELNEWDLKWIEYMAANEPLKLRFMIGEWIGVDIHRVQIAENNEYRLVHNCF